MHLRRLPRPDRKRRRPDAVGSFSAIDVLRDPISRVDQVVAVATEEAVGARPALEEVSAAVAPEQIGAAAADQDVVAVATADAVAARVAVDDVGACAAL